MHLSPENPSGPPRPPIPPLRLALPAAVKPSSGGGLSVAVDRVSAAGATPLELLPEDIYRGIVGHLPPENWQTKFLLPRVSSTLHETVNKPVRASVSTVISLNAACGEQAAKALYENSGPLTDRVKAQVSGSAAEAQAFDRSMYRASRNARTGPCAPLPELDDLGAYLQAMRRVRNDEPAERWLLNRVDALPVADRPAALHAWRERGGAIAEICAARTAAARKVARFFSPPAGTAPPSRRDRHAFVTNTPAGGGTPEDHARALLAFALSHAAASHHENTIFGTQLPQINDADSYVRYFRAARRMPATDPPSQSYKRQLLIDALAGIAHPSDRFAEFSALVLQAKSRPQYFGPLLKVACSFTPATATYDRALQLLSVHIPPGFLAHNLRELHSAAAAIGDPRIRESVHERLTAHLQSLPAYLPPETRTFSAP